MRKLRHVKRKLKASPAEPRLLAFYSLVGTKLKYCCVVWDLLQKIKYITRLERVKMLSVRLIYGRNKSSNSPLQPENEGKSYHITGNTDEDIMTYIFTQYAEQ